MELTANKFNTAYSSGIESYAINVDDHKIKEYIIEHAQLMDTGTCYGETGCDCEEHGYIESDQYQQYRDVSLMRVEAAHQILSDEYVTVAVNDLLYAAFKPFYEIIYNSDMSRLKKEIESSFDEFNGYVVVQCPNCKAWAVFDS